MPQWKIQISSNISVGIFSVYWIVLNNSNAWKTSRKASIQPSVLISLKMLTIFAYFTLLLISTWQAWEEGKKKKNLLHIHDQKWAPDGLKVEIIISGGRADLNVKAKNHRAAELKHENWHEHRQLLEALYYCLIQQSFVGNLVFLGSKATVCV